MGPLRAMETTVEVPIALQAGPQQSRSAFVPQLVPSTSLGKKELPPVLIDSQPPS